MAEFVAVNDVFSIIEYGSLKRQALMFDRIAIPNYRKTLDGLHQRFPDKTDLFGEYEWLLEKGIVFDPQIKISQETLDEDEDYRELYELYCDHLLTMGQTFRGVMVADVVQSKDDQFELPEKGRLLWESLSKLFGLQAREMSLQLRILKGLDAYPVLSSFISPAVKPNDKSTVIEVVLREFPVPDEQTPWEQIEEFRSDQEAKSKFFALKKLINDLSRMVLPRTEIEDNLKSSIVDYENHMRIHRLKLKLDILKIVAAIDFPLLAAAKLTGWGPVITAAGLIVSPLIAIKQQQVQLLEAEQTAPGREIAYIVKSKEQFYCCE